MMNMENYKGAIAWLRSSIVELQARPDDPMVHYAVLQSFEVTHNLSEAVLREAYVLLATDEYAPYVSLRELIWRASEEGIALSSRKKWLQYGIALEMMKESLSLLAGGSLAEVVQLLSRFADDLESFVRCLERRLAHHG